MLLLGPPGVGKSSPAAELSRVMKRGLIDIRLARKDPSWDRIIIELPKERT
ncbi:MAG: hypothetical protein IJH79_15800 [Lentisphaeria bacterium]|nr:hypothetical protein [Lentisphaeria bacterium]